ncbi:MAG: ABC transporter permease [Bacteriovoracaceae bacterium]|nr:ABC transporter permease [Bacteriovoracaceae bacterium]
MNTFILPLNRFFEQAGRSVIELSQGLGRFTIFCMSVFYWLPKRPYRFKLLVEQLYFIGNKSLFIVCLTASFSGMVMAYQTYLGFQVISADSFIGSIVAVSLAKELAPVFTGLIVSGRAGAAMAAQIGTMKVTEQVDALEVMGISSYQYLAVPRIVAGTLALPMLSIIFLFVGNLGSWLIGTKVLQIDDAIYFSQLSSFMHVQDIYQGVIKAFFFGFLISVIGTYHGFAVKQGAEGVGKGTNEAVVWGMAVVLTVDYFLTSFLIKIL